MIAWVEGVLREREPTHAVVDVQGVGYELAISLRTFEQLPEPGKTVSLYVRTIVREDAITLFGFSAATERRTFDLLLKASRVGPKLAQAILSGIEPAKLLRALRDGELSVLKRAPGVGAKLAERMVVELRDRAGDEIVAFGPPGSGGVDVRDVGEDVAAQLISALVNLGYRARDAERAIDKVKDPADEFEELLRQTLRMLAG